MKKKNYKLGEFKRIIEPNKESLKYLVPLIKKHKADFAVGFDCDADRAEIVTDKVIDGNYVLALCLDEVLNKKKTIVVVNDATSFLIRDIAKKKKCKIKEVETGEVNVVDKMLSTNSSVGGEGSNGGVIFPPSRCRDGILTTLHILRLLAKRKKSVNQIINSYPKYYNIIDKVKCIPAEQVMVRKKIKDYFLNKGYKIQETGDETGGLKIIKDDSYLFFRASKTEEGLFRIIADSKDEEKSKQLLELGKQVFNSFTTLR